ncbi:MAG: hypothetical protein AVDCRST_MAG10-289 [uncultured Acidimicrobiales bacterium]|uniref:Uncharacterized protein n=1 Tax=uncultured Acidimicrobiales bacterium TaxID=310071 RepID=A0A6J4H3X2_9ACTN|nr:MAG: hypothetical protein AVDCRST_MAG10-289 [uncultured Acidimicrobiales bacterium]
MSCAHPSHFAYVLEDGGDWTSRLRGVRAHASRRSHAELDEAEDLDDGDPRQLAREHRQVRKASPPPASSEWAATRWAHFSSPGP